MNISAYKININDARIKAKKLAQRNENLHQIKAFSAKLQIKWDNIEVSECLLDTNDVWGAQCDELFYKASSIWFQARKMGLISVRMEVFYNNKISKLE